MVLYGILINYFVQVFLDHSGSQSEPGKFIKTIDLLLWIHRYADINYTFSYKALFLTSFYSRFRQYSLVFVIHS